MATREKVITLPDMTDVDDEGGGGGFRIPEGKYDMECQGVKEEQARSGNDMLTWRFKGLEGAAKGKQFFLRTVLVDNAHWKLKQTAKALDIYEDGEIEFKPSDVVGTKVIGIVIDSEYTTPQGVMRTTSSLDTVRPEGWVEGETADTKKSARSGNGGRPAAGKKGKQLHPKEASEIEDMSVEELEDVVDTYGLVKVDLSKFNTHKRKAAAVVSALDAVGMIAE